MPNRHNVRALWLHNGAQSLRKDTLIILTHIGRGDKRSDMSGKKHCALRRPLCTPGDAQPRVPAWVTEHKRTSHKARGKRREAMKCSPLQFKRLQIVKEQLLLVELGIMQQHLHALIDQGQLVEMLVDVQELLFVAFAQLVCVVEEQRRC